MGEYIDIVLCKHDNYDNLYLFYAPPWSHLSQGDRVMVDTKHGTEMANVVDVTTIDKNSETFKFVLSATRATLPLRKVLSVVAYRQFDFGFEEENNGQD